MSAGLPSNGILSGGVRWREKGSVSRVIKVIVTAQAFPPLAGGEILGKVA